MKKIMSFCLILTFAWTAFLIAEEFYFSDDFVIYTNPKIGIVNASHVNTRKDPEISAPVVQVIKNKGTIVKVLARNEDWYKIDVEGVEAWIFGTYVSMNLEEMESEDEDEESQHVSNIQTRIILKPKKYKKNIVFETIKKGNIVGTNVNMRESASKDAKILLNIIQQKTHASLIEWHNGWYKVKLNSGEEGWIHESLIIEDNEPALKQPDIVTSTSTSNLNPIGSAIEKIKKLVSLTEVIGIVNKININLRKRPGLESEVVGKVQETNAHVKILKWLKGWFFIEINTKRAWIYGKFINFEKSSDSPLKSRLIGKHNAKSPINLRKAPDPESEKLDLLTKNDGPVEVLDFHDGWFQIKKDNKKVWISGYYLYVENEKIKESSPQEPEPDREEITPQEPESIIKEIEKPVPEKEEIEPIEIPKIITMRYKPEVIFNNAGVNAYNNGFYNKALSEFKNALMKQPDNPKYCHYIGKSYLKLKDYKNAKDYLNKAYQIKPNEDLLFDIAFVNYKTGDFKKSAELFEKYIQSNPDDATANYLAGISFFKEKQYEKALPYFQKASEIDPKAKLNSIYHAGLCYEKTGQKKLAYEKFRYVKDNDKGNDFPFIKEQTPKAKSFSIYSEIGYEFNDNVPVQPDDLDLYDKHFLEYEDEDDHALYCFLSGKYKIVNKKKFQLGIGYDHYQSFYSDLSDYDLTGSIFNLFLKFRIEKLSLNLDYKPSFYWLDSEKYLMQHSVSPGIQLNFNKYFSSRLSYSFHSNNYDINEDRDGNSNDVFLDMFYSFDKNIGTLFGGIGFGNNSSDHPDYEYDRIKLRLGLYLKMALGFDTKLNMEYYENNYDNIDSIYPIKREDSKLFTSLALSKKIFYDWMKLKLEYNYTDNDSNIKDFKYRKNVIGLSFIIEK